MTELTMDQILAFLDRHEKKGLLRFVTIGSVDDGKSTLIGRLLESVGNRRSRCTTPAS